MNDDPEPQKANRPSKHKRVRRIRFGLIAVLATAALGFNLSIAYYLANDEPDDGRVYSLLAVNLLDHNVFSIEKSEPFTPTFVRVPGYPLFLAGVYSVAGNGNDTAVRVGQAILYVFACFFAYLTAWNWRGGTRRRRRKAAVWTFVLAAFCPFASIYVATLLTETLTIFLMAAMTAAATCGLMTSSKIRAILCWIAAGVVSGVCVMVRPDAGLFTMGIGLTLLLSVFFRSREHTLGSRFCAVFLNGVIFSAAFCLVLVPWTVRNERVFGVFQPLSPAHGETPGEFVTHGYFLWLRTWIDDSRYIGPMLWDLGDKRINVDDLPATAFASGEEKTRVAALIDAYNNSDPAHPIAKPEPMPDADAGDDQNNTNDSGDNGDDKSDDSGDAESADNVKLNLAITPDTDSEFAVIAGERIASEPMRFYVMLPAKRSASMWFDTHSDYYPFAGELFPLKALDEDNYQHVWLPLFAGFMWFYTLIAVAGVVLLMLGRRPMARLWLIMAMLMTLPRIAFFGTLENPEPRYLVELFLFAAILGGIALAGVRCRCPRDAASVTASYSGN